MKFGQLVENNIRKILLKNYEQNEVDKLVPDSFIKNQNWVYLKRCWTFAFSSYKAFFLKKKEVWN